MTENKTLPADLQHSHPPQIAAFFRFDSPRALTFATTLQNLTSEDFRTIFFLDVSCNGEGTRLPFLRYFPQCLRRMCFHYVPSFLLVQNPSQGRIRLFLRYSPFPSTDRPA